VKIAAIDYESTENQWLVASDYTTMFNTVQDSILKTKQEWVDKFSQKYKRYMECCYCNPNQLQMLKQILKGDVHEFKLWESMISDSLRALETTFIEGIRQLILLRIHKTSQIEGYTLVIDKAVVLNAGINATVLTIPVDGPTVLSLALQYEAALQETIHYLRHKVDDYSMEIRLCGINPSDKN